MNETELRQALAEKILEAMERYAKAEKPIPIEWIEELKELVLN